MNEMRGAITDRLADALTGTRSRARSARVTPPPERIALGPDERLVVAIDTLVRGVHFPDDTTPRDVGYKALAVNLSDLAAMGADPIGAWIVAALPCEMTGSALDLWVEGFTEGFGELASGHHMTLLGSTRCRGQMSITVQVAGRTPATGALLRRGAEVGDLVYVSGTLGDAGLALAARRDEVRVDESQRPWVESRLARPSPRIALGRALRGLATAAIDVSDGLAQDLGHVLAAGGVAGRIEVERLPLSAPMRAVLPPDRAWALALGAGDDYELCFTIAPGSVSALEDRSREFDCPVTPIGEIVAGRGLSCHRRDGRRVAAASGYRHFH